VEVGSGVVVVGSGVVVVGSGVVVVGVDEDDDDEQQLGSLGKASGAVPRPQVGPPSPPPSPPVGDISFIE
jgi:hypothetical protein